MKSIFTTSLYILCLIFFLVLSGCAYIIESNYTLSPINYDGRQETYGFGTACSSESLKIRITADKMGSGVMMCFLIIPTVMSGYDETTLYVTFQGENIDVNQLKNGVKVFTEKSLTKIDSRFLSNHETKPTTYFHMFKIKKNLLKKENLILKFEGLESPCAVTPLVLKLKHEFNFAL